MTRSAAFPLTAYQRDIWAADAQADNLPQFNVIAHERLVGNPDVEALRAALLRTVGRNDALGLRIDEVDGAPVQWTESDPPEIELVDLTAAPDPAAACRAWIDATLHRPMPLLRSPLFEATLLRETADTVHIVAKAHHIASDGFGVSTVLTQARADYDRAAGADVPEIPAPSYRRFQEEDERYRQSAEYDQDRAFFRQYLGGVSPALFTRRAAPGARRSARHSFLVESADLARIRAGGNSVFSYVAAAFGEYLNRIHRGDEVVLGVPFLNRRTADEQQTVGQFANTLPLRVAAQGDRPLHEIAAGITGTTRRLRPHERLALGDVLRDAGPGDGGPRRLFDVTISFLSLPGVESTGGLSRERTGYAPAHEQDALAVLVVHFRGSDQVRVDLNHACDVFDEDFPIEAVAGHIRSLIRNGLDRPDLPARELALLTAAERAAVLQGGLGPEVAYASDATLSGLFEEQARRTPERTAVIGSGADGELTYAELDARANQVARALRAAGVGPDDRVAVLLERSPQLLCALLGVLKSGGAYVPVDPGYPQERIAFLLADSRAKAVLVDRSSVGAPPVPEGTRVLGIDELLHGPDTAPEPLAGAGDLAYVIYTSGSTGKPKGAMVEHRSVVNRLAWMQRRYPIGASDVILQKTPTSFDVSVWELFWWAVEGATVALLPADGHKDPREILRSITDRRVTVLHFVPSMLGPFLDLLEESPELRGGTEGLRFVFCSGEALPPARVDQFNRVFAGPAAAPRLVNLYGPTEATVDVSWFDCPADPARPVARVPIGRPIDNLRLYVLDPQGEPQPAGFPGELCIGGVGVARGYLDRPDLTRASFGDDPFTPGGRLYHTGDLARWLADGTLEYLGRIDDQVKIRGNRIEPGEVQSRLSAVPGVRAAAVVDRTSETRGTHLVGYYVADEAIDPVDLRTHLSRTLPEFAVPAHFVRIDRLPLTPNGKLDRRALPAPPPESGRAPAAAPRDGVEAVLAAVWAQVLQVESVGVHESFYALGGDSLLMLRVRAVAERLGVHFSLNDLAQNPTVAALAARSRAHPAGGAEKAVAPWELLADADRAVLCGTAGIEDAFPLTRLQLGLIYHSLRHDRSATYHDVFRYTLAMAWDEDAFRGAFDALVARHPALRSSMDLGGCSEPVQIVHSAAYGGLEIVDQRAVPAAEGEAELLRHVEERRYHRYDFKQAPLYLLRVYVRASGVEAVLSFHHALLDGGSVANLVRELLQDYLHALGAGIDAVADGAVPSPANHVRDERRALDSQTAGAYWRGVLEGAETLRLENVRPAEPPTATAPAAHRLDLPRELGGRIRAFTQEHALPVKSVLLAAHCLTLRLLSGQDEVSTGLVTHGRAEQDGAERTLGLFLNTVPVRIGYAPRTWLQEAREAFRTEQDGYAHRHYPLSAIQKDRGGDAPVETAFNFIHFHVMAPVLQLPGVELKSVQTWEETNFRLMVNAMVDPVDHGIQLRIDADSRTTSPTQTDLYAQAYVRILGRLVDHPHEEADFGFLSPEYRHPEYRHPEYRHPEYRHPESTAAEQPVEQPDVVTRFDRQVDATPEAVAVAHGPRRWTYRELGRAADQVAHRLITEGARPGARIAVAMDRSPETVAVILGVAKAGGACVPLDTGYPRERLTAMLETARPFRVIAGARHADLVEDRSVLLPAESLCAFEDAPPRPGVRIAPGSTAYILFTSGSTGRPKAVTMPHRALANLISWQLGVPSGAVTGPTLQFAPLGFDVAFQEIFSTLCTGATLQLVGEAERPDSAALLRLLDEQGVERVFLPYVALQQLAETAAALGLVPRRLRVLISAGEQLRVTEEIRRLCAALPGALLENQYGPTETHVVTRFTMTGEPDAFPALPPIGTAIDGAEVLVLDSRMRQVPPGVTGEIHLGGSCLADGYEGQAELTDERFVPHPYRPTPERLYRTGDLGYRLPGGEVVCLGRADSQVKVRGFRVEPAEVELAIAAAPTAHRALREVAVVARRRGPESFLAAYLVGEPAEADLEAMKRHLRTVLPDYMLPAHFEWLPGLPLTPSGKRDDAALRRLPLVQTAAAAFTPPADAYEQGLVEIAAELLQQPVLGVHDNLFDLGASSLTAMRLVVRIEQRFGRAVPLSALIAAPTVADLAQRLRSADTAPAAFDPLVALRSSGSRPPLFLAHPTGGNVVCYVPLARHLSPEQPLYGLQAAGGEAGSEPLRTVPALARSYVEALRRVQPHGPYSLGGWSFGGIVAFEMACQLKRSGEEVSHLIMIDSIALGPDGGRLVGGKSLLTWFFWEMLWLGGGSDVPAEDFREFDTEEETFAHIAQLAIRTGLLKPGDSDAALRRLFDVFQANWEALVGNRPDTIDQDITVIRAEGSLPELLKPVHDIAGSQYRDPTNGWQRLTTGRIETVSVPGDHIQVVEEPYVQDIAAAITAVLRTDRADRPTDSGEN
ncbi:amino acid adenylation domain-containing protein [Kitasatospora sp. NPDC058170]|uniref:amino acid adenylation domain-containing protein n=1 Tax=Kitasatospora sp. NPDC058170 TaxID=3346364 RepID=UPI0036D77856